MRASADPMAFLLLLLRCNMQHARRLRVCVNVRVSGCFAFCTRTNGDVVSTNVNKTAGPTCDPDVH